MSEAAGADTKMAKLLALVLFLLAALFVVRDLKAKNRLGENAE